VLGGGGDDGLSELRAPVAVEADELAVEDRIRQWQRPAERLAQRDIAPVLDTPTRDEACRAAALEVRQAAKAVVLQLVDERRIVERLGNPSEWKW
jgi:hypothetical protein